MDLIFNKNNFNIDMVNLELKNLCSAGDSENLLKMQLVNEEFLSNILFPNYENDVKLSVYKNERGIVLSYEYSGTNYLNKINESTMISLKILENKAKEVISDTKDGKTKVSFII